MEKMKMESPNLTDMNIDKLAALFPNCITETADENGRLKKAINFEMLRAMLSEDIAEGDEAYEFTWVGKKAAIAEANRPIRKTLRPCVEESVNWDTTENLYIEGDNLEVLKLLQESYLGKVKMIYIDPPYNTGNDFIYRDDFAVSADDYAEESGQLDEDGNRLFKNTDSNGRFHSDWCSMIYSRLMLARNLLSDDGVIFISIDYNEQENMKKICDEVFGEENCLGIVANINNPKGRSDDKYIATSHEYVIIYAKNEISVKWYGFEPTDDKIIKRYNKTDNNGKMYREIDLRKTGENDLREDRPNLFYYFYYNPDTSDFYPSRDDIEKEGYIKIKPQREDGKEGNWRWGMDTAIKQINDLIPKFMPTRKVWGIMQKDYLEGRSLVKSTSSWTFKDVNSERGTEEFIALGFDKRVFPKPKPLGTIEHCIELSCKKDLDSIILDFFSGSATTAHAVMQLNAEDGGHRKFIMVQLPEKTDESSEAYKAGYKNICEIGKERIRRAGNTIKAALESGDLIKIERVLKTKKEEPNEPKIIIGHATLISDDELDKQNNAELEKYKKIKEGLDTGFRVLKLDDTNMQDVYYTPAETTQTMLAGFESNIKPDRTDLDLLFGCLLDWGLPLSMPYSSEQIEGVTVHTYNDGDLIACFDKAIPESVIKTIAKRQPLRVVFRDDSFADSPSKINVSEIFKIISPDTRVKVI